MIPLGVLAQRQAAAIGVTVLTLTDQISSSNGGTNAINVGPASPNRTVFIAQGEYRSNASNAHATIDDAPTTEAVTYAGALSNRHHLDISYLHVPTGEEVLCAMSGVNNRRYFVLTSDAQWTHVLGQAGYSAGTSMQHTVTVPTGGFGIALTTGRNYDDSPVTFDGATLISQVSYVSVGLVTESGTVTATSDAVGRGLAVALFAPI